MVPLCDGLFYGKKTRKLQMAIEQRQVKGQEFFILKFSGNLMQGQIF